MKSRALNDLRLARLRLRVDIPENLPAVLVEAIAACLQIVEDRARFPELGGGRGQARFKFTESMRERDLRRLEAISLVSMCLLLHCDLVRLRCGKPRPDNSCDAIRAARPRPRKGRMVVDRGSYATLESETGLTRTRLFEALRDGEAAGYWTSHQPRKRWEDDLTHEERWRGFPSVRMLSKLFFQRLGIDLEWLEAERKKASERERQPEPAPLVDVRLARARQRVIREQRQLAAKTARLNPTLDRSKAGYERAKQELEAMRRRRE